MSNGTDRLVSLNAVRKAVEMAFLDERGTKEQIWEHLSTVTAVRCYTQSQVDELLKAEREMCAVIAETYYSSGGRYIAGRIRQGDSK
jgi:hypothetical protein